MHLEGVFIWVSQAKRHLLEEKLIHDNSQGPQVDAKVVAEASASLLHRAKGAVHDLDIKKGRCANGRARLMPHEKHLRSHVVERAEAVVKSVLVRGHSSGEAEVDELELRVGGAILGGENEVVHLDVTMHHAVLVAVADGSHHLVREGGHL